MSSFYQATDLSITIGDKLIVDAISFAIEPGEILALAGASGAGKSMTAMTPFGLNTGIASGSVLLDDTQLIGITELELRAVRAHKIGFVFQQPLTALTPHRTVAQCLKEAAMQAGAAAPDQAAMAHMLDAVGLSRPAERLRQFPHQLSGGERQRVLIAAALAHHPQLLVADEPVSALDAELRGEIMQLLSGLCRSRNMAMLLVSHDLAGIEHHADQLLLLEHGHVREAGAAKQIAQNPTSPYGQSLMRATPRLDEALVPLPDPTGPMLDATDINVRFRKPGWRSGWTDAVNGASLTLHRGETMALVGGSGSGKSTLGRAIAGLGPMDRGQIIWNGLPLPQRTARQLQHRKLIQPVFQDPLASLDPRWRVSDIIAEPLTWLMPDIDSRQKRAQVEAMLQKVELPPEFADRKPAALSGGQAQRVAIARALIADPEMLLLDEATSALDPLVAASIVGLFHRLQSEYGLSMLFITHDLALARRIAHRIAVMENGQIVETEDRETLFANPQADATKRLIAASV
jgi:ABC-type glutathione transport system ATPase component